MLMLVQVYCILTVSLEYCVPLAAMTLAYIRVGRRLWGAQTPGQVQIIQVAMTLAYMRVGRRLWGAQTPGQVQIICTVSHDPGLHQGGQEALWAQTGAGFLPTYNCIYF